jgi:hypothetical protein
MIPGRSTGPVLAGTVLAGTVAGTHLLWAV